MLRTSEREAARLRKNISGGLPFEAKKDGSPKKGRPLRARKRTATGKRILLGYRSLSEDDNLRAFFRWSRQHELQFPRLGGVLCFHTPNEGALVGGAGEGQRRQLKGVKAGVVDVLNLRPSRGFSYFAGELKVVEGELEPEQSEFIRLARAEGAFAHTYWCWPEMARALMWYLCVNDRLVFLSAGDPVDFLVPDLGGHDERCGCGLKLSEMIVYANKTVFLKPLEVRPR